jgi:predicted dehydrogenase
MLRVKVRKRKNAMTTIKAGIIGMGFIGTYHIDALRRLGMVELVAIADVNYEMAKNKADRYGIKKCYADLDELIADPEVQVVHNCTPNHMHLSINEKIIKAGKHIFSEKPLAKSASESAQMLELLKQYPNTVAGVNFCYRMNPLVQDMKQRIAAGELGNIYLVHGSYLQDWLLFDTDYNWRVETDYAGDSRCVADIGSHWIDTAQTVLGSKIVGVCADVITALPIRKKPVTQVETFVVNTDVEYEEKPITTEDYAGVLVKFDNGVSGVFHCSQVSAGRKCFLNIEVDGSKSSLYWNQEESDKMWKGNRDTNNEQVMRNPNLMSPEARKYTSLAAGHPEGWNDAFRNNFSAYYTYIADGKKQGKDLCDFATFEDGHYIMKLTEAIIKSGKEHRWVSI